MTTKDIWLIEDLERRFEAFLERWLELDEFTGNRTLAEHDEMAEIADAVMERLIREHRLWKAGQS